MVEYKYEKGELDTALHVSFACVVISWLPFRFILYPFIFILFFIDIAAEGAQLSIFDYIFGLYLGCIILGSALSSYFKFQKILKIGQEIDVKLKRTDYDKLFTKVGEIASLTPKNEQREDLEFVERAVMM